MYSVNRVLSYGVLVLFTCLFLSCPVMGASSMEDADRLWQQRDNQKALAECLAVYKDLLQGKPGDETILARLSIGYWWWGEFMEGKDGEAAQKAYQEGMAFAERLCKLNPQSAAGHFWHATNNSAYCREKGFFKSAVEIPQVRKRIETVLKIDKYYYRGGPQRLLARIIYHSPRLAYGVTGNLEDAEKHLKEAIARYPDFALSHLFLADIYWKMKEKEKCRAELNKVLALPEEVLPEFAPENRRDKMAARERLKRYFKN